MTDPQPRSLLARYCLDSSFFIDLWDSEGEFSRDVFKGIWDALEDGVSQGTILAPEVVKEELLDTEDAQQKQWISTQGGMFVPLDMGQVRILAEIVDAYPKYAEEPRNLADPGVVALAKCDELVVLTSEKRAQQHSRKKPKIPNVCEDFGVESLSIINWCRAEEITVVRS